MDWDLIKTVSYCIIIHILQRVCCPDIQLMHMPDSKGGVACYHQAESGLYVLIIK